MQHQFTTSYQLKMWSSSKDSQWSKSLKTLRWCMSCVWIDLLSWVCELQREESRENKEKCVVNCWMIITSSQMVFLRFSLKDSSYNFVGNCCIYRGERGEETHKIPDVKASCDLLLSWLTHKLLMSDITEFRISSMYLSHDLLWVLQSRTSYEITWLVQFFTNCRLNPCTINSTK